MDACYSGLAIQRAMGMGEHRFISNMLQRRSRQVITAGKANETVADGGGPTGDNSIFTGHLLDGLNGRAVTDNEVLTASHLMNYVYQRVSNDPNSAQTPHFGHLDGDGDFVLLTPNNGHLAASAFQDFLVKPIVEKPEPPRVSLTDSIKPVFAERSGYLDPESEGFGKNEWTARLCERSDYQMNRATSWLAIVVEPVSQQQVPLNLVALGKSLKSRSDSTDKPWDQFRFPNEAMTTAKSVILFDAERHEDSNGEWWKRFVRIDKSGALEFAQSFGIAGNWKLRDSHSSVRFFRYVETIGTIWAFLYAAKRIFQSAHYTMGVKFSVNLIGTKNSVMTDFAQGTGPENNHWIQPFDGYRAGNSWQKWKCHDQNLHMPFQFIFESMGDGEAKKLIKECSDQIGLAFNHQSEPRCFICGTEEFPWPQFQNQV